MIHFLKILRGLHVCKTQHETVISQLKSRPWFPCYPDDYLQFFEALSLYFSNKQIILLKSE